MSARQPIDFTSDAEFYLVERGPDGVPSCLTPVDSSRVAPVTNAYGELTGFSLEVGRVAPKASAEHLHPLGVKAAPLGSLHLTSELRYALECLVPPRTARRDVHAYSACRCDGHECVCVVDAPTGRAIDR